MPEATDTTPDVAAETLAETLTEVAVRLLDLADGLDEERASVVRYLADVAD